MPRTPRPWWRNDKQCWAVTIDGKRHNLGKDREDAHRRFHELMAKPKRRTIATESLLAIFDVFLDWVSKHQAEATYEWYRQRLEAFANCRHLPDDVRSDELRPFHVQQFVDDMDVATCTKRNYVAAVKRAMKWAKQQGYIDDNPIVELEVPAAGKRDEVISEQAFSDLLEFVKDDPIRDLLVVSYQTGCRPQESLRVEARHVDQTHHRWVFSASEAKNKRLSRAVYLPSAAMEITERLARRYPAGRLFRNSRGKPWTTSAVNCAFIRLQIRMGLSILRSRCDKPADRRRQYPWVDEADVECLVSTLNPIKQSGKKKTRSDLLLEARRKIAYADAKRVAPKYCLYILRHSWATNALERGVDPLTVAVLMGHKDPSTLAKVYQHRFLNPEGMLQQAERAAG